MNILFLTTWYPDPPDNGAKLRSYYLVRELAQAHRVTLISFAWDTGQLDVHDKLHELCAEVHIVHINPFLANQASSLRTFLSPVPLMGRPVPAMQCLVQETLDRSGFDVAIASMIVMGSYVLQAPNRTARMLEDHNSLSRMMYERYQSSSTLLQRARRWVSWWKFRRYEARLFPRYDLVTMVSDQDRDYCLANLSGYDGPIAVVPNGVDCQRNQPGLVAPRPSALVFNGSLTYEANYNAMQYFLADIYPHIRQRVPDATLDITGSIKDVDVTGLKLDDSVTLTGHVDDIRRPVASASVCVVPIRRGGGTRLKILEAMALGTPVVATSKGAEGIAAVDGEHILLADDPASFAGQVVRLLDNHKLRQSLVANARRLVETHYDWQSIGSQFVRLVEQAVEARRRLSD